ncbi:MAG: LLM class F420-dependent oxidoreductase [Pseudomonadales bacterium]
MEIGIFSFSTDYSMPVDQLAVAVEERGFESLWVPEHTHIPASRETPYPFDGGLPKEYSHTLDPFVALAIAAGVTQKIKLCTGICLAIEHQALTLAKTVATLDHVSNGRVILGLGAGWNREEMENHGTQFDTRFRRLEEQMQALTEIWTQEEATFHGEFENFDRVWSWPKPLQSPRPPLILGGETDHTLRRVAKYADGWLPRISSAKKLQDSIVKLHGFAKDAGRDPVRLSVSAFAPPLSMVESLRDTPVDRAVLWVPPDSAQKSLELLDRYADVL